MRFFVLAGTLVSLNVFAQQAPPCTKELAGVLFDFGTPQAPRLFKCDGRTWAAWSIPPSLCTAPPPAATEPAPAPAVEAPPPMPPLETLPPLPKGPAPGTDVVANNECRRQCMLSFNQCVKTRCGTAIAASCRQSCDKQQTKCVTGCP